MLTVKEMFLAADVPSGAALLQKFQFHPLYLSSVSRAYEQQVCVCFVDLISMRALLSDQVKSYDDFVNACRGALGQMTISEVTTLKESLEAQGIFLRYISKDLRRAALVASTYTLSTAPATPIDGDSFITVKDDAVGDIAAGGAILGGVIFGIGLATQNPWLIYGGGGTMSFAGGYLLGRGLYTLLHPPDGQKPKPTSENDDTPNDPNDLGDPNSGEDIETPKAVVMGDEEDGIDTDGLLQTLATNVLDDVLDDLPLGWDADSGSPMNSIGPPPPSGGDGGDDGFPVPIPFWG
jgi:hypothetical protein